MEEITREHWEQRYSEGYLPWDSGITPPEVEAFWQADYIAEQERAGSWALDMGSGTGTNVAYLGRMGFHAVGVELASNALHIARDRIGQKHPHLQSRIHLVQGSVTAVPLHGLNARYVLDIGCLHTVLPDARPAYAQGVIDNIAPGGYYQLYAFDWMADRANDPNKAPRGLREGEVESLFAPHLTVVDIEIANPNPHPCRWYLLRR